MLIAPTQSATPLPRQVNRRIYFHTIIAASKALQFTVAMRARLGRIGAGCTAYSTSQWIRSQWSYGST